MKNLTKLILITYILGFTGNVLADPAKEKAKIPVEELKLPAFEKNTISKDGSQLPIELLDITAPVNIGSSGSISVKSTAKSHISIDKSPALTFTSSNAVDTDESGKASFTFKVNPDNKPGMLPVLIKSKNGDKSSELKTFLYLVKPKSK